MYVGRKSDMKSPHFCDKEESRSVSPKLPAFHFFIFWFHSVKNQGHYFIIFIFPQEEDGIEKLALTGTYNYTAQWLKLIWNKI